MGLSFELKAKHGGRELKRLRNIEGKLRVKVGVLAGAGNYPGTSISIALAAWWNEFGTLHAPERPFMRWTLRENGYYREAIRKALKDVLQGKGSERRNLGLVGAKAAKDVQEMIRSGPFEPNAPITIVRKSTSGGTKNKPLIDTGLLLKSIGSELKEVF